MNLAQGLLNWPQAVARQTHAALFLPTLDMHPSQFERCIPPTLAPLSAASLSQALRTAQPDAWDSEFDGRQLSHRLALLPRHVLADVAWHLGLVLHAPTLRQVVLREELDLLDRQGLDGSAWTLVFKAPTGTATSTALRERPVAQWSDGLRLSGEQSLIALSQTLPPSLGQRLRWKLPAAEASGQPPAADLLSAAYTACVPAWSTDWDACLGDAFAPH